MQSSSKHFVVYLTAELIYHFNSLLYISDYDKKPKNENLSRKCLQPTTPSPLLIN